MAQVDDNVLNAVMQTESGGNPNAVSNKGAIGLFQVEPGTAAMYGVPAEALYHPEVNRMVAKQFLSDLVTRYRGNLPKALAAYNAGWGNVDKGVVPPETQNYVRKVLGYLGEGASYALGEGTAEAGEFPTGEVATTAWSKLRNIDPNVAGMDTGKAIARAPYFVSEPDYTHGPPPAPEPALPPASSFATYQNPGTANIFKEPRPAPIPMAMRFRNAAKRSLAALPGHVLDAASMTDPSRFGHWVDSMTTALEQSDLDYARRNFGPQPIQVNMPLIRRMADGHWEMPMGDPRSPVWQAPGAEEPQRSALKQALVEAMPYLVVAGAPLAFAATADLIGIGAASGAAGFASEFMWNAALVPAVASAMNPMFDKVEDSLTDAITRSGLVAPDNAPMLSNGMMNVFRWFPQLLFFPHDAATLANSMTQRDIVPHVGDISEWMQADERGPWVKAVQRWLTSRGGSFSKFVPFTVEENLRRAKGQEMREMQAAIARERAEMYRKQLDMMRQWEEQGTTPPGQPGGAWRPGQLFVEGGMQEPEPVLGQ